MPDERAYEMLDYIEFLESKYALRPTLGSTFQRFAEGVEDTLRAGRSAGDRRGGDDDISQQGGRRSERSRGGREVDGQRHRAGGDEASGFRGRSRVTGSRRRGRRRRCSRPRRGASPDNP